MASNDTAEARQKQLKDEIVQSELKIEALQRLLNDERDKASKLKQQLRDMQNEPVPSMPPRKPAHKLLETVRMQKDEPMLNISTPTIQKMAEPSATSTPKEEIPRVRVNVMKSAIEKKLLNTPKATDERKTSVAKIASQLTMDETQYESCRMDETLMESQLVLSTKKNPKSLLNSVRKKETKLSISPDPSNEACSSPKKIIDDVFLSSTGADNIEHLEKAPSSEKTRELKTNSEAKAHAVQDAPKISDRKTSDAKIVSMPPKDAPKTIERKTSEAKIVTVKPQDAQKITSSDPFATFDGLTREIPMKNTGLKRKELSNDPYPKQKPTPRKPTPLKLKTPAPPTRSSPTKINDGLFQSSSGSDNSVIAKKRQNPEEASEPAAKRGQTQAKYRAPPMNIMGRE